MPTQKKLPSNLEKEHPDKYWYSMFENETHLYLKTLPTCSMYYTYRTKKYVHIV